MPDLIQRVAEGELDRVGTRSHVDAVDSKCGISLAIDTFDIFRNNIIRKGARRKMAEKDQTKREYGTQRLDDIMRRWGLSNHDMVLVGGASEQLTHKQVQRARNGRKLTFGMMQKIMRVLNEAVRKKISPERAEEFHPYLHRELFSYAKGHDAAWMDPNRTLYPENTENEQP